MNGVHDMGGMHGMGPVVAEENEPVFHDDWERRVFALNNAVNALGIRNIDESRHARERMEPARYMNSSYYEIWLDGLVRLLTEKGIVSAEELSGAVVPLPVGRSHNPKLTADKVAALMDKGGNFRRENGKPARFRVGQPVRARNIHPAGHTRLPWYARGKTGEIVADYGLHVFADTNAHGHEDAQHLYNVRFSSTELWGPDGTVGDFVHIDLWDAHLETVR